MMTDYISIFQTRLEFTIPFLIRLVLVCKNNQLSLFLGKPDEKKELESLMEESPVPSEEETSGKKQLEKLFDGFILHQRMNGISKARLMHYATFKKRMLSFHDLAPFRITKYDFKTHDSFRHYLSHDCNNSPNTVGKYIKVLKVFFRYCRQREGVIPHPDCLEIKNCKTEVRKIHLGWEEVEALRKLDLCEKYGGVRDAFLFSVFTGLRFGDVERLGPSHTDDTLAGLPLIRMVQQKTGREISFSINAYAEEILEKYEGRCIERHSQPRLLLVGSNSSTNEILKELGRMAGLDKPEETTRYRNGLPYTVTVPRYALLTFHTGRHTYAVQSLLKGMPIEILQKQLGHNSIKDTMHYAKTVDEARYKSTRHLWDVGQAVGTGVLST